MLEKLSPENTKSNYAVPYYEIPYDKFFQFGFSVDCVVFGSHQGRLKVLLIKRGALPFKGHWALPGDLVYPNENMEDAANRILRDLTGIDNLFLEQTKTYSQVDRHPAGRVITTGFYALINIAQHDPHASAWADGVYWVDVDKIPELAFDHDKIADDACTILKRQVSSRLVALEILPPKFTLGDLQTLHESLLEAKFDKANFRKRMLSTGIFNDLNEFESNVPHRPGRLYSINRERYNELKNRGIDL